MRTLTALGVLVSLCSGCCTRKEPPPRGPGPIVALKTDVTGLSGMTRDERGVLWAVGEAGHFMLRIDPATFAIDQYPVVGAPLKTDLEALAWIADGRFVVGTETQEPGRSRDALLYGRIEGHRFVVGSRESCDYGLWGQTAPKNHGIEGLCHADGVLILATELIDDRRGRRSAPLATLDLETRTWTAHRVGLTSNTGKLAALGCRVVDDVIVAMAVERHFGISRLLRFEVPKGARGEMIEPTVVADLSQLIEPLPNFEGLVWDADGSVVLLTDNEYRSVARGSSQLYFVPESALQ